MPRSKSTLYRVQLYVPNAVMGKLTMEANHNKKLERELGEIERVTGKEFEWTRVTLRIRGRPDADAPMVGKCLPEEDQSLPSLGGVARRLRALCAAWLAASDLKTDSFVDGKIVTRSDEVEARVAEYQRIASRVSRTGVWRLPYVRKSRPTISEPTKGKLAHGGARQRPYFRITHIASGVAILVSVSSRYGKYLQESNSALAPSAAWRIEKATCPRGVDGMSIWTRLNQLVRDASKFGGVAESEARELKDRVKAASDRGVTMEMLRCITLECPPERRGFPIPSRTKVGNAYVVAKIAHNQSVQREQPK